MSDVLVTLMCSDRRKALPTPLNKYSTAAPLYLKETSYWTVIGNQQDFQLMEDYWTLQNHSENSPYQLSLPTSHKNEN